MRTKAEKKTRTIVKRNWVSLYKDSKRIENSFVCDFSNGTVSFIIVCFSINLAYGNKVRNVEGEIWVLIGGWMFWIFLRK